MLVTFLWLALLSPVPDEDAETGAITIRVVDADGKPRSRVDVQMHAGLVHYDLAPDFDGSYSLQRKDRKTNESGKVTFEKLPAGSYVTAFARIDGWFGVGKGPSDFTIEMSPTGSVKGVVSAKKDELRLYSIQLRNADGWNLREGRLDLKGNFEIINVPAGKIEVSLERGNWVDTRTTVNVKPGKVTKIRRLKATGRYRVGADPIVDASRLDVIDAEGEPMGGLSVAWASPADSGRTESDDRGRILLHGGSVSLGPPPFQLLLGRMGGDDERYLGRLHTERRSGVIVQVVAKLREVTGNVRMGDTDVTLYRLYVVTDGETPRVWRATVYSKDDKKKEQTKGHYRVHLPPGEHQLFLGTVDGRLVEQTLAVEEGSEPMVHVIEIPVP